MLTLDVGCGSTPRGTVNVDLLVKGGDPHVFDVHTIPNFVIADAKALPFKNNVFSKTTCFHVLEHVSTDTVIYEEFKRVTNGLIEIRVPLGLWEDFINKILFFWRQDLKEWRKQHHVRRYTKNSFKLSFQTVFNDDEIRVCYGYASFVAALKFVVALVTRRSTPKKHKRKAGVMFPFPFEIVASICNK